jgi:hypothetical protein
LSGRGGARLGAGRKRDIAPPEAAGRLNGPVATPRPPRPRSKYRQRERSTAYMLWVKRQPCLMRGVWGSCEGAVEADHAGRRGAGRKAHDGTCIPLCHYHHQASRFPRWWPQERRRAWLRAAIVYTQACARVAGVSVPVDPEPAAEYPTTAVDVSRWALAAIAASPLGTSGDLEEVVAGAVDPPLARRDQRGIHRGHQVGASEGEQPGAAQVLEQLRPLGVGQVDPWDGAEEHLPVAEVGTAHPSVGEDPVGEVAESGARGHEQSCSS